MDDIKTIKSHLHVGYTFVFKGNHCTITRLGEKGFQYATSKRSTGNYMDYWFFGGIPHYKSTYHNRPKPKKISISEQDFEVIMRGYLLLLAAKNCNN